MKLSENLTKLLQPKAFEKIKINNNIKYYLFIINVYRNFISTI